MTTKKLAAWLREFERCVKQSTVLPSTEGVITESGIALLKELREHVDRDLATLERIRVSGWIAGARAFRDRSGRNERES